MKYLLFLLLSLSAFANLHLAPPSFDYRDGKAVFMDIKEATYDIKYYPYFFTSRVKTTFTFELKEEGYPLFDFVPMGIRGKLNGKRVPIRRVKSPGKVTSYRVVKKKLKPGTYTLVLYTKVKRLAWYGLGTVNSGFFIKDLKEKKFLEKFVPANLEYDQYPMTFNVRVKARKAHKVVANGNVKVHKKNHFTIHYPAHYGSSSVYFHVFKQGKYKWVTDTFRSIDGRDIPFTIYTKWFLKPEKFLAKARGIFNELEADYGPWPQDFYIVYGMALKGGMEYPGATATSLRSLGHEMFHTYFAKGVVPADGNSGWMDEGLASWRDRGYKTLTHPGYDSFNLGGHSVYKRNTDKNSYKVGRAFFAYLNSKFNLKYALKDYFQKHKYQMVTTNHMINHFEQLTGLNLRADFSTYVLGGNGKSNYVEFHEHEENEHHIDYTDAQIKRML
ncbi:MAG: hypothetical protein N4A33_01360 [Bacteriovoracaceae bacterium]|nr:hypothetical protein [Bacteriovoracaceae bacterium]